MSKQEIDKSYLINRYTEALGTDEFISDGVISPVDYKASKVKVMFLNREPNDEGEYYDLPDEIMNLIRIGGKILPQNNFRSFLMKDFVLADCICDDILKISKEDFIKKDLTMNEEYFVEKVKSSAICNFSKIGGGSKVKDWGALLDKCRKGLDVIISQILDCNPTVIFGGNICDTIIDAIETDRLDWGAISKVGRTKHMYVCELVVDGHAFPMIDLYHPSYVGVKGDIEYWYEALTLMQEIERENPGYWKRQIVRSSQ